MGRHEKRGGRKVKKKEEDVSIQSRQVVFVTTKKLNYPNSLNRSGFV